MLRSLVLYTLLSAAALGQTASTYLNSAENRFRNGDLDGAIADLSQVIALDPKNEPAYVYRGFIYLQKGTLDAAIADFTSAIALVPTNVVSHAYRAAAWTQKREYDAAVADARRAITLDPRALLPYRTLVNVHLERAYVDKSQSEAERGEAAALGLEAVDGALKIAPDDFELVMFKGLFLRVQASLESDAGRQKALAEDHAEHAALLAELLQGLAIVLLELDALHLRIREVRPAAALRNRLLDAGERRALVGHLEKQQERRTARVTTRSGPSWDFSLGPSHSTTADDHRTPAARRRHCAPGNEVPDWSHRSGRRGRMA
jgi:tetratricopeptide (TPR) repeat protein